MGPSVSTSSTTNPTTCRWSVMMPTYNPDAQYLEEALRSVLVQDPGAEQMQIEVVDDCSPKVDVEKLVSSIGGGRVHFSKTPKNLGLTGCWNTCIDRARGDWLHILHQDDFVLPGFYAALAKAADQHPDLNLIATRSFFVDEESVTVGITERVKELENGGRAVDSFFYHTPIQCPGIVVRRSFYKTHGGFLQLASGLDCEMWARAIGAGGGMVLREALACYRYHSGSETGRLARSAEIHEDTAQMNRIFAERYPAFNVEKGRKRVLDEALKLANRFNQKGDAEAAENNLNYWKAHASFKLKARHAIGNVARKILGVDGNTKL